MNRIVFGSANHWTSPYQVGSHAWARLFAHHHWQTAYISDPISPWHFLHGGSRERLLERLALWKENGIFFEEDRLRAWTPGAFITPHQLPLARSRWVLDHWHHFSTPSVASLLGEWDFNHPEILWLDSIRHAGWGRQLRPKQTVLRIADWAAGFHAVPNSALTLERELIDSVDLVITSAQALEKRICPFRGKKPLVTIRNGVDVDFWKHPVEIPIEYSTIPEPRVIYVGALDTWFDLPLLANIARAQPQVSFVMIGQRRAGFGKEIDLPNLYWLGTRSRHQVRGYLQHAQVGIIPFKRSDLIECVCPLKLYEYMACGLPVVATRWEELELMDSPARLATKIDEWVESLTKALSNRQTERPSLERYSADNSWEARWKEWERLSLNIPLT